MSKILYEGQWRYTSLTPTNLTGEKAIGSFLAGDDLRFPVGSASLNSAVVTEGWNGVQMTIRVWIESLNFSPGDGLTHYILDNQGTGASQNRIELYFDTVGLLIFDLHDSSSTQHRVQYDASSWTIGTAYQIFARFDLNADEIELYTDGTSRDSTPDNALSSDTLTAVESTTQIGADTSQANQLNGAGTLQIFNRSWSDAEVTSDYNSGSGTSFVVDEDTILMADFSNGTTNIIYHTSGKLVSSITAGGTEATFVSAAGSDVIKDNDPLLVMDATGYSKYCFADGDWGDTGGDADDGAGAAVSGIAGIGVSMKCDASYYAQGGDVLDIGVDDYELDFWMRQDGDPSATLYIFSKDGGSNARYFLYLVTSGSLYCQASDAVNNGYFYYDITSYLDNRWHHFYLFCDRSNIATCSMIIDNEDQAFSTGGIFPVLTLTNAANFIIGARSNEDSIFEGSLKFAKIHIGGTMASSAQILYAATHPGDLTVNSWTLDGTREAWLFDENTATTITAGVTSPGNDLILSSDLAWNQEAFISRNLLITNENGGIGGITVGANQTVTKDSSVVFKDSLSLKNVWTAADDGDESTLFSPTLVSGQAYLLRYWYRIDAVHASTNIFVDIDGSATPILTRQLDAGTDDKGTTYALSTWLYHEVCFEADQAAITVKVRATGAGAGTNTATVYLDKAELFLNMVVNPGMEGGADPPASWIQETNATVISDTSPHSGTNCLKATAGAANVGASQAVTLVDATNYTVTAYAKVTAGDTAALVVDKGDGTIVTLDTTTSTTWVKLQGTFLSTGTSGVIYLRGVANGDIVWFDDAMIERNGTAAAITDSKASASLPKTNPIYIG